MNVHKKVLAKILLMRMGLPGLHQTEQRSGGNLDRVENTWGGGGEILAKVIPNLSNFDEKV